MPLDCQRGARRAWAQRRDPAARRRAGGRGRARHLAALARGPARALRRERRRSTRGRAKSAPPPSAALAERLGQQRTFALVLERAADRAAGPELKRRREALRRAAVALRAHDPERTLERGYALAEDAEGEPVTSAGAARAAGRD